MPLTCGYTPLGHGVVTGSLALSAASDLRCWSRFERVEPSQRFHDPCGNPLGNGLIRAVTPLYVCDPPPRSENEHPEPTSPWRPSPTVPKRAGANDRQEPEAVEI